MASLSQCPKGHFFDRDIYSSCPYCSGESRKVDKTPNNDIGYTIPLSTPSDGNFGFSGGISTVPVETETQRTTGGTVPPWEEDRDDVTFIIKPIDGEGTGKKDRFVVGWLAAIDGPYKGKSFELHSGYNRVGREEGDLKLDKDKTISRSNHFRIVYDAEDNHFLFFAGESDNYPRVNGEKKYGGERAELHPYSEIRAGESVFLFVPLCSEQFQWGEQG